jgi:outer membrane protein assembly factor BamE (lipoprotein component of BamABCDE complex)
MKYFLLVIKTLIISAILTGNALSQSYYSIGSSKAEVLRIQGKPTSVSKYTSLGEEVWDYGNSSVTILTGSQIVKEWSNRQGNLKVRMIAGPSITSLSYYTDGSHKDDVIRLQGTPTSVSKYTSLGEQVWDYGNSTVTILTGSQLVKEWSNRQGNLKVRMIAGPSITSLPYYTVGSHKDDVIRLQGTPSSVSKYISLGEEVWDYGNSTVTILTGSQMVKEWSNRQGNLNAKMDAGTSISSLLYYTVGSHKDDVIRLQGTPTSISKYASLGEEVWDYENSSVTISTRSQKVIEWSNRQGNLTTKMNAGTSISSLSYYTVGSHKDDVIKLQGTPTSISRYPSLGEEVWDYGNSTVTIALLTSKIIAFSNNGNLKSKGSESKSKIMYHQDFGGLKLLYREDKSFANIIDFKTIHGNEYYGYIDNGICYYYDHKWRPLNIYSYGDDNKTIITKGLTDNFSSFTMAEINTSVNSTKFRSNLSVSGSIRDYGDITFYDLFSDYGNSIHGTTIDFGTIGFDDFYTSAGYSVNGSRIQIGNFEFGDWRGSDGQSFDGSIQRIGDFNFYEFNTSHGTKISGTTFEIGDFSFADFMVR